MTKYLILIFVITFFSCERESISYNPFKPNVGIKLETIIKEGFSISYIEYLTVYEKDLKGSTIYFFYDHKKEKVIGEGYFFYLDTLQNVTDSIKEKLQMMQLDHNFNLVKPKIKSILMKFNASIISPISYLGYTKDFKFLVQDKINNKILNCELSYLPNPCRELISIENFYYDY